MSTPEDRAHRQQAILAALDRGGETLQQVADRFGITRQRAHQIYKQHRQTAYRRRGVARAGSTPGR